MSAKIQTVQQDILEGIVTGNADALRQIEQYLLPNAYLSAGQAIAIYRQGYVARLMECLRADYPVLRFFLGEDLFTHFATEYIDAHPPSSYSLFELGAQFPWFLHDSCPLPSDLSEQQRTQCMLAILIAKFERVLLQTQRAEYQTPIALQEPDYHSKQALLESRVRIPNICVLGESTHNLPEYFQQVKAKHTGAPDISPQQVPTLIAISRSHFQVHMHSINVWQYALIETTKSLALQQTKDASSPIALADVVTQLESTHLLARDVLLAKLSMWLPVAVSRAYIEFV